MKVHTTFCNVCENSRGISGQNRHALKAFRSVVAIDGTQLSYLPAYSCLFKNPNQIPFVSNLYLELMLYKQKYLLLWL